MSPIFIVSADTCELNLVHFRQGTSVNTIQGVVAMCFYVDSRSVWVNICDVDWDINDATVVCRQLGLPTESTYTYLCIYIIIIMYLQLYMLL